MSTTWFCVGLPCVLPSLYSFCGIRRNIKSANKKIYPDEFIYIFVFVGFGWHSLDYIHCIGEIHIFRDSFCTSALSMKMQSDTHTKCDEKIKMKTRNMRTKMQKSIGLAGGKW